MTFKRRSSAFTFCDKLARETPISAAALVKLRWCATWANQAREGSSDGSIRHSLSI
ncbi:hypothetical protein D9M69_672100 [compost metagenome]